MGRLRGSAPWLLAGAGLLFIACGGVFLRVRYHPKFNEWLRHMTHGHPAAWPVLAVAFVVAWILWIRRGRQLWRTPPAEAPVWRRTKQIARGTARLYRRRDWATIVVCIAVGIWLYVAAADAVSIRDPAFVHDPAVFVLWHEPSPPSLAMPRSARPFLELDLTMRACVNPIRVTGTLDYPFANPYWRRQAAALRGRKRVVIVAGGGVGDAYGFTADTYRGPFYGLGGQGTQADTVDMSLYSMGPGVGGATTVHWVGPRWPAKRGAINKLEFEFQANWVERRGAGSCYVRIPDTAGFHALADQNELQDEAPYGTTTLPAQARVVLQVAGGSVDTTESIPRPSYVDQLAANWTCKSPVRYRGHTAIRFPTVYVPSCGVLAIVNKTNGQGSAEARVFVYGALLGLFLAILIDAARRIRLPSG